MTTFSELQAAFWEMSNLIDSRGGWIITVFERDDDPRVHGCTWGVEDGVVTMPDDLYALYCAHCNIENTNYRSNGTA